MKRRLNRPICCHRLASSQREKYRALLLDQVNPRARARILRNLLGKHVCIKCRWSFNAFFMGRWLRPPTG
jgi:hypothetical protein